MFGKLNLRPLWAAGLFMLAAVQGVHAYEHWEIVAHQDCVAHTAGDHGDDGSRHDHGCNSHDHAPALAGGIFVLTVCMPAEPFFSDRFDAPTPPGSSIDHPPQLS